MMKVIISNTMYDVSILIATHQRAYILGSTLDNLAKMKIPSGTRAELIIVPNGCTDETLDVIHQKKNNLSIPVRCVEQKQASLNKARNLCLKEARGEILAFVDDDAFVTPGWLVALTEAYRMVPADLLAGRVTLKWETGQPPVWCCPRVERLLSKIDNGDQIIELFSPGQIAGANFSFRRHVIQQIGPFADNLGRVGQELLSGEDTEIVQRALRAGCRMFYSPYAEVLHWIPTQRANLEYLSNLSKNRGKTRVALALMEDKFKPIKYIRGGATMYLLGGAREVYSRLTGNLPDAISGRLLRVRGSGMMQSAVKQWIS